MDKIIKVMLVDDEMAVRLAYSMLLENDGRATVVAEAGDQAAAITKLKELANLPGMRPDVIALDVRLPEISGGPKDIKGGVRIIPPLKEISPETRILLFTQETEDEPMIEALAAGADGYIWKDEANDAIATAIQNAFEGKLVVTISVAQRVLGKFRDLREHGRVVLPFKKRHKRLSELLYRTMVLYCYQGLSAKEIAEREHISLDGAISRIRKAKEILGTSSKREAFRIMSEISEDTT